MAERQQPWGKWYWGDWRKDARLRRCCYGARGLWADMLSLMGGECDRFGFLMMEGQALGPSDLVGLLGGALREVTKLLAELGDKRVYSRTGDPDLEPDLHALIPADMPVGVIFSRRMLRDKAKAERDRENGKGGGNPRLNPQSENSVVGVNPQDKAQKPEARDQKPEASSLRSESPRRRDAEPDGFAEFYTVFPRKTARPAAAKAYAKALKRASAQTLLQGAVRYAQERSHEDPHFTKHPATWLNNDCWLDEPAPTKSFGGRHGGNHKPAQQSALSAISEAFSERNSDGPGFDVSGRVQIGGPAGSNDPGRADEPPSLFGSPAADAA